MKRTVTVLVLMMLGLIAVSGVVRAESFYQYTYTTATYDIDDDIDAAVVAEFGPGATVAEWQDLVDNFTGSIAEFCDAVGIGVNDGGLIVRRNGERFYPGTTRQYFVQRHDGAVPPGFLVHDQIDNNTLDLGSWPDDFRILVRLPDLNVDEYAITTGFYGPGTDLNEVVRSEFGPEATVANWTTLKSEFSGHIRQFCDQMGIGVNAAGLIVQVDGEAYYYGERIYFVQRHDGVVPPGFLVHDTIDNHDLDLGSWPDEFQILVRLHGGTVSDESQSWSQIKQLYSR